MTPEQDTEVVSISGLRASIGDMTSSIKAGRYVVLTTFGVPLGLIVPLDATEARIKSALVQAIAQIREKEGQKSRER